MDTHMHAHASCASDLIYGPGMMLWLMWHQKSNGILRMDTGT